MLLDGKVAVITGASRGIGRAVAIELAKAGAKVVVNYAGNAQAAQEVQKIITEAGGQVLLFQADVANGESVKEMIKATLDAFGRIDILVNNAGITRDMPLAMLKEEDWDAVLNTNLKAIYNCSKAVIKTMMKQKSGKIINMSSVVGLTGNNGQTNYAAAKAGVVGFTKSLAREVASRGITVNAVAPGYVVTDMTAALPEQARLELINKIPLAKLGAPEDVAAAVLFLASPAANYITGQTLNVDGGMVM